MENHPARRRPGWPANQAGSGRTACLVDLKWLGIDWDEGPVYQSRRTEKYAAAVRSLVDAGLVYGCVCSRKEVEAASSAPHAEDGSAVYPGVCRGRFASPEQAAVLTGKPVAIRFEAPAGEVAFDDLFAGGRNLTLRGIWETSSSPKPTEWRRTSWPSWWMTPRWASLTLFAATICSTPRHARLCSIALGLADRIPRYCHLPLVVGTDGRRLAKRHGDTRRDIIASRELKSHESFICWPDGVE